MYGGDDAKKTNVWRGWCKKDKRLTDKQVLAKDST